jgi:hypothetical protein
MMDLTPKFPQNFHYFWDFHTTMVAGGDSFVNTARFIVEPLKLVLWTLQKLPLQDLWSRDNIPMCHSLILGVLFWFLVFWVYYGVANLDKQRDLFVQSPEHLLFILLDRPEVVTLTHG